MNRFLSLILLMAAILLPATSHAQKNMSIQSAFTESYTSLPGATETLLTRSKLHDVNLSLYHALSIPGQPEKAIEIERMVLRDGSKGHVKRGQVFFRPSALRILCAPENRGTEPLHSFPQRQPKFRRKTRAPIP